MVRQHLASLTLNSNETAERCGPWSYDGDTTRPRVDGSKRPLKTSANNEKRRKGGVGEVVGVAEAGGERMEPWPGDGSGCGFSANGLVRYRTVQPVNVNPHTR